MGRCGTSRGDPYHPGGTPGQDGQLGPRPLSGTVWDIPGRPIPSRHGQLGPRPLGGTVWDIPGRPYHPGGSPGRDGQLGPGPLGGTVWDIPGRPIPSRWDTGTGWAARTKASAWDGVGHPGETHTIPVGHCDGMGSCDQGLWVGWCGTSRGDPYHPSRTPGLVPGTKASVWDGVGYPNGIGQASF